jgi:hypothetical protein
MALSIDIQRNSIECHHAECCYADYHNYLNVMPIVIMLRVIMLNVIMLSVVMLNIDMLSVVAPPKQPLMLI